MRYVVEECSYSPRTDGIGLILLLGTVLEEMSLTVTLPKAVNLASQIL